MQIKIRNLSASCALMLSLLTNSSASNDVNSSTASKQVDAEELAKKLADPIADMVTLPIEWVWAQKIGANNKGQAQAITAQPVIPYNLPNANAIIFRPMITAERQTNIDGYSGYGIKNIQLQTYYAPHTDSSWIYGAGPYLATPSISNNHFGSQQTGGGLNGVVLNQIDAWTYGIVAYQSWSLGGSGNYGTQNNLYANPFVAYVTENAWTYSCSTETVYNYDIHRAQTPFIATISKLVMIGNTPVSYEIGTRYNLASMPGGAQGWGLRASLTFVLSK